jgi:hypothetical protein
MSSAALASGVPLQFSEFTKFTPAILSFSGDPQDHRLLIAKDGPLSVHYAPFEWINPSARVVLVGITPGKVQALNALREAQTALREGAAAEVVLARAKRTGAFSGPMRQNLIAVLDRIGLHNWLGLGSCSDLFGKAGHLLQTASVLQFPVFFDGANYNGTPDPAKSPLLRAQLLEHFAPMARALPGAVFVPLGPVPTRALTWLASQGHLEGARVLQGMPHPSGANAERIAYFLGRKDRASLSSKTDPLKLDIALEQLRRAVHTLPS